MGPRTSGDEMKSVFVDVDGTLMLEGRASRFFFRLASLFQALGRGRQHANRELVDRLATYGRIVVLTSRDVRDIKFTSEQLKKAGLRFDEIVCAPRRDLLTRWKFETVTRIGANGGCLWVDDMFRDSSLKDSLPSIRVEAFPPEMFGRQAAAQKRQTFEGL